MALASEWPHVGHVWLCRFGPAEFPVVQHHITGEIRVAPFQCSLAFDEQVAYLEPAEGVTEETVWLNELLDLSVHGPTEADASSEAAVWSKQHKIKTSLNDHRQGVVPQALVHESEFGKLVAELYIFKVPQGSTGLRRFWSLPRLQEFLLGPGSSSKWICNSFEKFVGAVRCPFCMIVTTPPSSSTPYRISNGRLLASTP